MMKLKIIRTETEYEQALARSEELMDAIPGSPEEEELEVLAILIEKYEEEHFPIDLPDPVEAIQFRMEQQDLTRKDLIPYLGSQSKVSEILNRKRPLSLAMIRALHEGLGIPAEVLLQEPGKNLPEKRFNPMDFPLEEMVKSGYFPGVTSLRRAREQAEELLEDLLAPLDADPEQMVVYCRNANFPVESREMLLRESQVSYHVLQKEENEEEEGSRFRGLNEKALRAWQARVLQICESQELPRYKKQTCTEEFIRHVAHLSVFPNGPILARQVLLDSGIHFVILSHLPHTYLDGACFRMPSEQPVVGMTLRYDRLDNFWFTLMHELAHVLVHLEKNNCVFFDDVENGMRQGCSQEEEEANRLGMEFLISFQDWENKKGKLIDNPDENLVKEAAREWNISPAIVAGRLRWETNNYTMLGDLLGKGTVRKMFLVI
ncbi:MAG: ImmA/IrrE family metallo-endopeptidase [Anaerolineaceae bacterium]